MLQPCETYQPDKISSVKITHWQGDGWRGEYLKISYGKKSFTCKLGQIVDHDASITFPCSASKVVGKKWNLFFNKIVTQSVANQMKFK